METVNLVYSIYIMVSTIILVSIAGFSYLKGRSRASKYFTIMMLTIATYTFFYSLELLIDGLDEKILMAKFEYIGLALVPFTYLVFSTEYTSMGGFIKRWLHPVLLIIPVFTLMMVFTNQLHNLFWTDLALIEWKNGNFLARGYGPLFWVFMIYLLSLMGLSTFFLLRFASKQVRIYKLQALLIIIAALVPWLGSLIYILFLTNYPYIDTVATPFLVMGIILFISIFKYRLFNLIPIALDKVFENIGDPIIVVNEEGLIVNMNPSAEKVLKKTLEKCYGKDISNCIKKHGSSLQNILDSEDGKHEFYFKVDERIHHFEIILSRLEIRSGMLLGRVLMFRDITKEKEAQKILVSSKDSLAKLVDEKSIQLQNTITSLRKEVAMREEIEKRVVEEWKRAEFYLDLLNHDMSNINQDMLSRVQIMGLHQGGDGVFRSHLNHLEMSLKRSIKLIKNVKTLNKLASTPATHSNQELMGIIRKIIYQMKNNSKMKGVDIEIKNNEKDYLIRGGRYIEDIFRIIIENGIEVQEKGRGKIKINISQHPHNKGIIRTEISDHGPGIPDHTKVDLLNREKRMGDKMLTGVSLLIARVLAERYGGRLKIQDRILGDYRRGASFVIDLKKA